MMKIILALLLWLSPLSLWAGDASMLLMGVGTGYDEYTFTTDPDPVWTLTGATWTNPSVTLDDAITTASLSNSIAHGSGNVTIEYYKQSGALYSPSINGVVFGATQGAWDTDIVYLTGSSGIEIDYLSFIAGLSLQIRKITVPKP